jgi:hypothetical protein
MYSFRDGGGTALSDSFYVKDNQQALSFLQSEVTYIEAEVFRVLYPEIMYPQIISIDTSAGEWAKSITYYGLDRVGEAGWFSGMANNMPMADINRFQREQGVEMAGIGYRYTLEEIGQAMMIPGLNLTAERAEAARRASEEFIDRLVRVGDTQKGVTGLFNNTSVPIMNAAATGTGSSPLWSTKTADEIVADVQNALTQIQVNSQTVEYADTVLLPVAAMQALANTRIPNTPISALEYLQKHNFYTMTFNRPLTIRQTLNLDTASASGGGRGVVYRNDRGIVRMHVPAPFRFLPVWQTGPMTFDIPGYLRVGSVEFRRPNACLYLDGIS